jgi:hypothetical protein
LATEDVSLFLRVYRDEFPMLNIAALRPFQHLQKRSALLMPTNWITIPTPKQSTMGFIGFLIQKSTGARCRMPCGLAGKFWPRFRDPKTSLNGTLPPFIRLPHGNDVQSVAINLQRHITAAANTLSLLPLSGHSGRGRTYCSLDACFFRFPAVTIAEIIIALIWLLSLALS